MRTGIVADVHVGQHKLHGGPVEGGLNRRCREVVATLARAVRQAEENGCRNFVVAGDLIDYADAEPQVLRAIQLALTSHMPTYLVMGNHDMRSDQPGDHGLGPLAALPNVEVVERPKLIAAGSGEMLIVPFQPGDARVWLPPALEALAPALTVRPGGRRALVLHLGIVDEQTAPFLRDAHDAIPLAQLWALMARHGINWAFAGNWHSRKFWNLTAEGRAAFQIGTLCPTGWDNPGPDGYGSLLIYDRSDLDECWEVGQMEVAGPRFLNVQDLRHAQLAEQAAKVAARDGGTTYVRWKVGPEDSLEEAVAWLRARVEDGTFAAAEALPDRGDEAAVAREAARGAAKRATAGEAQEDALAAYVAAMPLPDGVDRAAVLAASRRFLAQG